MDPSAPVLAGSMTSAQQNEFATVDMIHISHADRKGLKSGHLLLSGSMDIKVHNNPRLKLCEVRRENGRPVLESPGIPDVTCHVALNYTNK